MITSKHHESIGRIEKKTLYRQVFEEIKLYIINKRLVPGDKLDTETELCRSINVSRNVLREALIALQLMGVIDSSPRRGIVIREFSFDSIFENIFYALILDEVNVINELRQVRSVLEVTFFKEACNMLDDDDLLKLEKIVSNMGEYCNDWDKFGEYDKQFHNVIFSKIRNKTLLSLLNAAWIASRDIKKATSYVNRSYKETYEIHKAIFLAIKKNDCEEAERQLCVHFMVTSAKEYETIN